MTGLAHVIDAVIAITLLECVILVVHHRLTGRGVAPGDFLATLASGLCLMLALRGALAGAGTRQRGVGDLVLLVILRH